MDEEMMDDRSAASSPPDSARSGASGWPLDRPAIDGGALGTVVALLGGFAFGSLAAIGGEPVGWLAAGLAVGIVRPRGVLAASVGIAAAAMSFAVLGAATAPPPPAEYSSVGALSDMLLVVGLIVATPIAVHLGGRFATPVPVATVLSIVTLAGGICAVIAIGATSATLATIPATRSFAVSLPVGWEVLDRGPGGGAADPAFGMQYTAIRAEHGSVPSAIAAAQTIGMSVFTLSADGACPRDTEGWPGSDSPVYHAAYVGGSPVSLPAGPADHEIRSFDPEGSRLDVFGWLRTRHVGVVSQSLCYILAVRSPAGVPFEEAEIDAIAAGVAFR
jgi:hypothetical protein